MRTIFKHVLDISESGTQELWLRPHGRIVSIEISNPGKERFFIILEDADREIDAKLRTVQFFVAGEDIPEDAQHLGSSQGVHLYERLA
jgi:hypothetical protein